MGLPTVNFSVNTNGLGRPLPGYDHYSMFLAYYKAAAAVGAYSGLVNLKFLSLVDAEDAGIVDTCAEATAAISAQVVTGVGADGDTIVFEFDDYDGTTITLGSYTKVTADSTVTLVKTALVNAVNALTYSTGWSATAGAAGAWTLNAPKNRGIYPNGKSVTETIVGTLTNTNAALSGGTKSRLRVWHSQIKRFFVRNPKGVMWFSAVWDDTAQSATAFETQMTANIVTYQNAFAADNTTAAGARQFTVYSPERTFATTMLTAIQAARTILQGTYIPACGWLVADLSASALSAFPNTRTLSAPGCSAIISQSSVGDGLYLYSCQQTVHGHGGEFLGAESITTVSGSIGEVQAMNISDGTENEKTQFIDSSFSDYLTLQGSNPNILGQLNDYGYVFGRKIPNVTGTYINEGNCAVAISNDLAYREGNRTIEKVIRNFYSAIVVLLNAKNYLNSDSTLADRSVANYIDKGSPPLTQMAIDGDLSQDPSQNGGIIISSAPIVAGVIPITLKLIPVSIGREINVNVGFVASI